MFKSLVVLALLIVSALSGLLAQSNIEREFYRGNYAQALQLFDEQKDNSETTLFDFRIAALCNIQMSNYDAAIENYRAALVIDNNCNASREGLADALLVMGYNEEALENYDLLLEKDPDNLRLMAKKAAVFTNLRNYYQAGTIYEVLYNADPVNNFYFRSLLSSYYKQKQYYQVIGLYSNSEEYPTGDKELLMMLANSFFRIDQSGEALGILEKIIEVDSLYAPAIERIAQIHFSVYRNYQDAAKHYRIYNALNDSDDPLPLRSQAVCEYFLGNFDVASQILDSLTQIIPEDALTFFYAGLSHKMLGDTDRSLELLIKAADKVIPDYTANIYHHLGQAYASKRMLDEAIETYKKVLELDPDNYQVLYDLAVTFEEYTMNRTIALAYYEQFVKASQNARTPSVQYAEIRIKRIREELFLEGE
jgi:tetratricopeptide (TPR) repeat protein